ncbi:hypothetical protein ACTXG6_40260 [Pseudonocardia sp. Cha107L01]|uniref:hypothetical protein n=1 Tax=Pseudonocardia sp. Cha107L01 TaxID=3457576 RepID=UPI00403EABCE
MRTRGPILTLLAIVGLAFVLLAVNMNASREEATDANASAAGTTSVPPAVPPPVAPAAPPPAAPPPAVSSDFPRQASYAGRTSGRKAGEATVEIVIRNGAATAYLCDGKKLESWLNGDVSGSTMTLRGKGTNELTATLRSGTVSGTVSVSGVQWQFNAEPGKAPTAEKRADKAASVTAPNPARSAPAQSNPAPTDPSPKDPAPTGYSDPYSVTATSAAGAGTSGAGQ